MAEPLDDRVLTVGRLEEGGFRPLGEWELHNGGIKCSGGIPNCKGVYAFALNDRVMYVGLASRSLRQRLTGYRTPGPTQSTNIRLRTLLLDCLGSGPVSIHYATPPDITWNGLPVSVCEGLEAALISRYDLPWNRRGTSYAASTSPEWQDPVDRTSLSDRVLTLIAQRPDLTEAEIARTLFGKKGYQQKVNPICRALLAQQRIERHGSGGPGDPFLYRLATPSS